MLILLPPSEGKTTPLRGDRLDLAALSFPALAETRSAVLASLEALCRHGSPGQAAGVLGLGPTQAGEATANTTLRTRPCAPAIRVYSGVLYDALDYPSLSPAARRRAGSRLAIASALWGLVRPNDRIPSYRLGAGVKLPGIGAVNAVWRHPVEQVLAASRGLVVDMRSGAYTSMGPAPSTTRTVTVRVLHDARGARTVVSHHNKATKGRVVRTLLEEPTAPVTPADLANVIAAAGFVVEHSGPTQLDIVVSEL